MFNARKKIVKEKGAAPTELEEEVAKALFDIEVSPSSDIKSELRDVYISSAKEIDVKQKKAVIVHTPYRCWATVKKIQGRLIRELEKKFSKRHVIFVANRTCQRKSFFESRFASNAVRGAIGSPPCRLCFLFLRKGG